MNQEALRSLVEVALAEVAPPLAGGDGDRLLAVLSHGEGWQIQVASDELDLAEKAEIESRLLDRLAESGLARAHFAVYFKRSRPVNGGHSTPGTSTSGGPRTPVSRPAPFGLRMQKRAITGVRQVVVVASGKGGVGKSTVSTNLAVAMAAQGRRVGLLDADIYGPSAPLMLGLRGPLAVSPGQKLLPQVAFGVKTVSFGFFSDGQNPVIWRGPMVAKALEQLCFDVDWGELDVLVVDLPPGTGDVQLTLAEKLPIHGAVVVTTPQDVALIDAEKAYTMFQKLEVPILGIVENMAVHSCTRCGHGEAIFGAGGVDRFAANRGTEVLARLPLRAAIRERSDRGDPPGANAATEEGRSFQALAQAVATKLYGF